MKASFSHVDYLESEEYFGKIHSMGVNEFKSLWLEANILASNTGLPVNFDRQKNKIAISRIILETLRVAKRVGFKEKK